MDAARDGAAGDTRARQSVRTGSADTKRGEASTKSLLRAFQACCFWRGPSRVDPERPHGAPTGTTRGPGCTTGSGLATRVGRAREGLVEPRALVRGDEGAGGCPCRFETRLAPPFSDPHQPGRVFVVQSAMPRRLSLLSVDLLSVGQDMPEPQPEAPVGKRTWRRPTRLRSSAPVDEWSTPPVFYGRECSALVGGVLIHSSGAGAARGASSAPPRRTSGTPRLVP